MTHSHTPGPWKVNTDGELEIGGHSTGSAAAEFSDGTIDYPEALANLRLTAAAPDLLASLQALVKWMDDSGLSHTKAGGSGVLRYEGHEYSVVADARAAITKAQGQA